MGPPSSDSRDLSSMLLETTVVLTAIGAAFVFMRLWLRFWSTKAHSWDDYFIIGALVASFASMSLTVVMVHYGYGKPIRTLSHTQATTALKFSNFAILINGIAMAFLKISIGLSLLRLQLGKGMVWIVWFSVIFSVLVNALAFVNPLFGCRPLAAVWDKSLMPVATCFSPTVNVVNSYIQTAGNIITDLFYSLGPLYYLSKVKVSVYNKWALRGVFIIGLLATVCSIAKSTELPKLRSSTDPTYDGARLTIWVRAELNAGLVAAAIPPLKSLFEQILRRMFGVRHQLRSATGYVTRSPGTRRSRAQAVADDEIAMRSHAAYVRSDSKFYPHQSDLESIDDVTLKVGSQHVAVGRREHRLSSDDLHGFRQPYGQITKTMSYSVRNDHPHDGS